jgi:hypothetical protein
MSTTEDGKRLRTIAKRYHVRNVLLAAWKKGIGGTGFQLAPEGDWRPDGCGSEVVDLDAVFR